MAERRMFARRITDSDQFLEMPDGSQKLYLHLCMHADDDGFVNNVKGIMRTVRSGDDDIKILVAKKFVIPFESGVMVVTHWRMHNYLRNDRYRETDHKSEKQQLVLTEKGEYVLGIPSGNQVATTGTPLVDAGKDSIGKYSEGKDKEEKKPRKRGNESDLTLSDVINEFTQHEPLRNELAEFIKTRQRIKAPLTVHSLQLLLTQNNKGLYDLSGGNHDIALEIVQRSNAFSYRGFFPLNDSPKQQKPDNTFLDMLWRA